jgi:hypothetical protein
MGELSPAVPTKRGETMEKSYNDMSDDERIAYLVDQLRHYLFAISYEARKTLGLKPEDAKNVKLLALIEGVNFGNHDTGGAMDLLDHLSAELAEYHELDDLYEGEEDEEEDEESESDELESVEA